MKAKHILSIINSAVKNDFEFDPSDTIEEIWQQAEDYLLENEPEGHLFVQCDLRGHVMSQYYCFVDKDGHSSEVSGEIFDFPKAKKEDEIYFRKDGEKFIPVNWFEIPDDEGCKSFVFVYDKVVCCDGVIAYLYDSLYDYSV